MPDYSHPILNRDYPQVLLEQQTESPAPKKGERTKQTLIWACAQLLNQIGYQELRVSDICETAQVSNAVFYLYFKNKEEITQVTLEAFSTQIYEAMAQNTAQGRDNRTALYTSNLAWLKIARLNAGLMRCILQVSLVMPTFADFYDSLNSSYIMRVAKNIAKRTYMPEAKAQMLVFSLSSMTDEFTRRLLSDVDSPLDLVIKQECPTDAELAEFLSDIWYQAIYS